MQLFPEVPILRFHEYLSLIKYLNWYLSQNFEKQVHDVIVYLVTIIRQSYKWKHWSFWSRDQFSDPSQ